MGYNWEDHNYHNDRRVRAAERTNRLTFDARAMTLVFTCENDDGEEIEHTLPAHFEVCPLCEGKGSHTNPSIDASGITGEEFAEWGEDERESYISGAYDVACYECKGARVVPTINESNLSDEQRASLKLLHAIERDNAAYDAESRAERMMGC